MTMVSKFSGIGASVRRMTGHRLMLVVAAFALMGGAFIVLGGEAEAKRELSTAQVVIIDGTPTGEPKGGSWLVRGNHHLDMSMSTIDLDPGVYTVWWVIFNRPENCQHPIEGVTNCSTGDFPPKDENGVRMEKPNPAKASSLWATGIVVGEDGIGNFHARLIKNFPLGEVNFGPGLKNPKGAEVHLVIRSHGGVSEGEIAEQISSFNLGCNTPDGKCKNVQASIHMP